MVRMAQRALWGRVVSGQYDDGLVTFYDRGLGSAPGHIQHTGGIIRTGVRLDTGSVGLNNSVKSVHVRFRKYGNPTGPITVNIRKASDDTVAATLGTWNIQNFPAWIEQTIICRLRTNTYNMVTSDLVLVEFPSSATDGFEISTNTTDGAVPSHTGRQFTTVYANTAAPPAITIKT